MLTIIYRLRHAPATLLWCPCHYFITEIVDSNPGNQTFGQIQQNEKNASFSCQKLTIP